ncbi:hypothetical protein [Caballeronia sp. BR00000012568055]|uniref:hypothetical protein n=1 Tax=Caballeronia sp. BR00000012568055 TaxID=2918761 RepID=UPI0023F9DA68|nr:hypothetical protein [Caballeronia sp. BR00000012568055]
MQKEIEVGDYMLSLDAVPQPAEPQADDEDAAEPLERYAIRVRVTRLDHQPLHGSKLADDSGEMTGGHGPFETVAEAIAHGEAWGRHYIARVLGHSV